MPVFPDNRFKPRKVVGKIAPYDWPQDSAQVPAGHGLMPDVELQNKYNVRQEGFIYTTSFLNLVYQAASTINVLPIQADGDFWCNSILLACYAHGTTNLVQASPRMQIEDIRTGWRAFYPHGRALLFTDDPNNEYCGSIVQDMVFTRNGGIRIILNNDTYSAGALDVYIAFNGWKEYQFASR